MPICVVPATEAPPPARALTERERCVLQAIARLRLRQGYPPTMREVADEVGYASAGPVHAHITRLRECGYLADTKALARALVLTGAGVSALADGG